jgi:hypothetical protein
MNTENLLTLASYLDTLPDDYERFCMSYFLNTLDPEEVEEPALLEKMHNYQLHNGGVPCGTVACAVGHGPAAGLLMTEDEANDLTGVWVHYAERVFGMDRFNREFYFLFGANWTDYDNTPKGAAARIRYVVAGGEVPNFSAEDYYDTSRYETYRA